MGEFEGHELGGAGEFGAEVAVGEVGGEAEAGIVVGVAEDDDEFIAAAGEKGVAVADEEGADAAALVVGVDGEGAEGGGADGSGLEAGEEDMAAELVVFFDDEFEDVDEGGAEAVEEGDFDIGVRGEAVKGAASKVSDGGEVGGFGLAEGQRRSMPLGSSKREGA